MEHLHPSRLAKQDHFELASSARARLKWRSTDGRDITPSNTLSFGAKALSTTIEVGGESEVVVPPVVSSCTLRWCARRLTFSSSSHKSVANSSLAASSLRSRCVALAAWMGI